MPLTKKKHLVFLDVVIYISLLLRILMSIRVSYRGGGNWDFPPPKVKFSPPKDLSRN